MRSFGASSQAASLLTVFVTDIGQINISDHFFSCDMGTETAALRCLSGLLWAFAETEPLVQVWRGGAGSRWGALLLLSLWGCRSGALRPSGEAWGVKVVLSSLIRPYPQASGHN